MPVPLRSSNSTKAEAKYNVTTEYSSFGLHAAAAKADLGLVEYALSRGQPVNSVLDGVLPLHAACSGGTHLHIVVVKKLIEHGADVNAPRLPRRYSNDKNRDNSQPIVGTSGSTPLHFAAANGNANIISILLQNGAVADRSDKYGVTPEMLARQAGWTECADLLRDWIQKQNHDLAQKESLNSSLNYINPDDIASTQNDSSELSLRKRLQMKRSVECAINMLKPSTSTLFNDSPSKQQPPSPLSPTQVTSDLPLSDNESEPSSPMSKPFGQYTFYPTSPVEVDPSTRRPSLPQVNLLPSRMRKTSNSNVNTGSSRMRRPRSAGSDSSPSSPMQPIFNQATSAASTPPPRKVGSKLSLMNLFKRSQTANNDTNASADSLMIGSTSTLPLTNSQGITGSPFSTRTRLISDVGTQPRAVDLHNALTQAQYNGGGMHSFNHDSGMGAGNPMVRHPNHPRARVNSSSSAFRPGHLRNRSGSKGSGSGMVNRGGTVFDENIIVTPGAVGGVDSGASRDQLVKRPAGPGILRTHNRSNSSSVSGNLNGSRSLRFDSALSPGKRRQDSGTSINSPSKLKGSTSVGSLKNVKEERGTDGRRGARRTASNISQPETINLENPSLYSPGSDVDNFNADEDEEEYGVLISGGKSELEIPPTIVDNLPLSTSQSSFSASAEDSTLDKSKDFPFSIARPPPIPLDEMASSDSKPVLSNLQAIESRNRGESFSSTDTRSTNPGLSSDGSATGSGNIRSPGLSPESSLINGVMDSVMLPSAEETLSFAGRRDRVPLDISIRSISSHAQAEELVKRAEQSILDMEHHDHEDTLVGTDEMDGGWTPLSVKLAAYGKTLAVAKKLKEEQERGTPTIDAESVGGGTPIMIELPEAALSSNTETVIDSPQPSRRDILDRQLSLQSSTRPRTRIRGPRRPNTGSSETGTEGLGRSDKFLDNSAGTPNPSQPTSTSVSSSSQATAVPNSRKVSDPLPAVKQTSWATRKPVPIQRPQPDSDTEDHEHPIVRSHTPGFDDDWYNSDLELTRVATTPVHTSISLARSNQKLMQMGFPVAKTRETQSRAPGKKFSGLKSFFKGSRQ